MTNLSFLFLANSAPCLCSGPNPPITAETFLYFPWATWVPHASPKQQESQCWMGIQSADLCFYCHSHPAWIWEKPEGLGTEPRYHAKKWTQKTKILPLSDLLFLFHFYHLTSFHSPFPIMLHLSSIVLLLTILKYFKDPPAGHQCSFQGKLVWFSLHKAELCQMSSPFRRLTLIPDTSWRKSADLCWPHLDLQSTNRACASLICVCTTGLRWHWCVNHDPPSKGAQLYQMIPLNYKLHLVTASKAARFHTIFHRFGCEALFRWSGQCAVGGRDGWYQLAARVASFPNASAQSA